MLPAQQPPQQPGDTEQPDSAEQGAGADSGPPPTGAAPEAQQQLQQQQQQQAGGEGGAPAPLGVDATGEGEGQGEHGAVESTDTRTAVLQQDAFLVFRALCKLSTRTSDTAAVQDVTAARCVARACLALGGAGKVLAMHTPLPHPQPWLVSRRDVNGHARARARALGCLRIVVCV